MTIRKPRIIAIAAILACGVAAPVSADTVADFYKGKTVKLLIGVGMGSTYGLHARFFADTIRPYIPGNPNIVVQSMPGGGGAKMANYLYNVAPKDGSYIGFPLKYIAVNQMLGRKGLKYDAAKFGYLGSLGPINSAVAILKTKAPATTLEDVMKTEIIMGSTGKSSETFITPTLMNNLLGTKFKIVSGYRGMKGITLAIERGEVHGRAGSWDSLKAGQPQWLDKNQVSIIALSGLSRNWDLRNVPTLLELATTPEQKSVLQFFANGNAVGWLMLTPPGLPKARLAAFQNGFDKTMKNAGYMAKVKSKDLDVNPINHTGVEKIIADTLAVSPQTVGKIKQAMGVK
jgi:tripartite-type tricarboxylate transporter receptor subunit TctC